MSAATGAPAVSMPLAGNLAAAPGLPLLSVLMLKVVVFSRVTVLAWLPPDYFWWRLLGYLP